MRTVSLPSRSFVARSGHDWHWQWQNTGSGRSCFGLWVFSSCETGGSGQKQGCSNVRFLHLTRWSHLETRQVTRQWGFSCKLSWDFCQLTLKTRGAKLTKAVFGVRVDQLTGDRESNAIRRAFYRLHGRRSSRLPKQQIIVYSRIQKIKTF